MKRAIVLGVFVCLVGRLAAAEEKAATSKPAESTTQDSKVLAYFGDKPITLGEIDHFIRRPTSGPAFPDEMLQRQRQQGLSQYLMRMIYEGYAEDHPGLVTDAEIDATVKKYEDRVSASGRKLEDALQQFGMTMPEFRKRLVAEVVNNKLMEKAGDQKQIADFYEKHKGDFDGTQFTAKHILIQVDPFFGKPEDHEAAKATLEQIKKDVESGKTTFDEAISRHSEDPGRAQGPTLPPFPRFGMMVEPFAAAASGLKAGEISQPVKTIFGYHLIQLISRQPGQAQTLEQAKDAIQNYFAGLGRDKMIEEERTKHPIKVLMPYVKPPRPSVPPRTTRPTTRPMMRPTTQSSQPAMDAMKRRMLEQLKERQSKIESSRPANPTDAERATQRDGEKQ